MEYILSLTVLLAPTYAVRFSWHGIPLNLLMVWVAAVWVIILAWLLYTKKAGSFFRSLTDIDAPAFILITLFSIAGIIALFVGGIDRPKLGQFIVWFLQPLTMFFITRFVLRERPGARAILVHALYIFLGLAAAWAFIQYVTLHGLPVSFWGNSQEPKRAISFFTHPNSFALFIAPILAFLLPDVFARTRHLHDWKNYALIACWLLGGVGLLLSFSRGGWLGLAAALVVYLFAVGNKKYVKWSLVGLVIVAVVFLAVPNLRWRVVLPFYGERSASARVTLWQTGWRMVKDSPIAGKGLLGSSNKWDQYAVDPTLGHYPFPHNIFLDAWIDTGLFGLVAFIGLLIYGIHHGLRHRDQLPALGLALFLIALTVHGQVDNPYFKNDLALLFWMIWALAL